MEKLDINLFLKNLWFFLFYFILLLLIASFGTVAEAALLK
jgi:hypothetical protein